MRASRPIIYALVASACSGVATRAPAQTVHISSSASPMTSATNLHTGADAFRFNLVRQNSLLLPGKQIPDPGPESPVTSRFAVARVDREGRTEPLSRFVVQGVITGRVTDAATGEPLSGVQVAIVGTTRGALTGVDGRYSITAVPAGSHDVRATSVGYRASTTRVTVVSGQSVTVDFPLAMHAVELEGVVAVGYGTQQRRDVTGSVASVSRDNIENLTIATFDQALQGQVAGVRAQQTSGVPGAGMNIQIRGVGSVSAGSQPLYVIDGFPVEQRFDKETNPLAGVNPNDIESIQVLKDASAASIYGSRGANGVVLITTRSGRVGRPRIEIDSYTGLQERQYGVAMMDPVQLVQSLVDSRNNAYLYAAWRLGVEASASDPNSERNKVSSGDYVDNFLIPELYADVLANPQNYVFTDWQDVLFRRAPMHSTTVSASGGTASTRYFLSGNYMNQDGILVGSGFNRYSARLNADATLSSRARVGVTFSPSYSKHDQARFEGSLGGNVLGNMLTILPLVPVYCEGDNMAVRRACPAMESGQRYGDQRNWGLGTSTQNNPLAEAVELTRDQRRIRMLGNSFFEFDILPELTFRTTAGADIGNDNLHFYHPSFVTRGSGPSRGSSSSGYSLNLLNENTLNYRTTIAGRHDLSLLGGVTAQTNRWEETEVLAGQFPNDLVKTMNAGVVNGGGSWISEWSLLSYLTRLNYGLDNKYLLSLSLRQDGSSRFGENNKWGTFPSASAGWVVSEEPFMRGLPALSELKLRASYGQVGNFAIGDYSHVARLAPSNYILGPGTGTLVNGLRPSSLSNADLGWEKATQYNAGLDVALLDNRVRFVADYYHSTNEDLLLNVPIPGVMGFSSTLMNIGKVRNAGWEFALGTFQTAGPLTWTSDFNIAWNRNKVLALGPEGDPIIVGNHITEVGGVLGSFYGWVFDGIFQNWDEVNSYATYAGGKDPWPGDVRFRDVNGDGVISSEDRTNIGNNQPDFVYGWTNNLSYRNLDARVVVQGIQGNHVFFGENRFPWANRGQFNQLAMVGDYWKSEEQPGTHWRPFRDGFLLNHEPSSHQVADASFLRINNVTLGYRLPGSLAERVAIQNARIYLSVQNAYTFTDYKVGFNPEVSTHGDNPLRPGADTGSYPVPRVFSVGVNLGL
jgi:TonB-dependent starch-binding outer membrane protein SusC